MDASSSLLIVCGVQRHSRRMIKYCSPINLRLVATTAFALSFSMTSGAFQQCLPCRKGSPLAGRFSVERNLVTYPDTLPRSLSKSKKASGNTELLNMYRMSEKAEHFYPQSEMEWQAWLDKTSNSVDEKVNPLQFKGLSTTSRKQKGPRRELSKQVVKSTNKQASTGAATTKTTSTNLLSSNRSSTMPGFASLSEKQLAFRDGLRQAELRTGRAIVDTPEAKNKRRKDNGQSMYQSSASVPESLVQFADEIHREERITREEEITLGEKTQEALRLQNVYDILKAKLDREPADDEWCAAAGKINMEAIRLSIEEGSDAKNKLVTSNLRMVQSVVNTYIRNGLSAKYNAGDMMQEGILALIRAAEKFEPDRGWKFSTYAMYWIRASVKRSQIYQSRILSVPQRLYENRKRLVKIEADLTLSLGRKPTRKEMGELIGMSEIQVDRCFAAMDQRCYSLDQALTNTRKPLQPTADKATLIELIAGNSDDGEHDRMERKLLVQDLVETLHRHLTPKEVEILLLRYGLQASPKQIHMLQDKQLSIVQLSQIVGLKPDMVRRMIRKSLEQLKSVGPEEWIDFQNALQ
jgi:RNA polymerase sigma factor (sigma-70 family)